MQYFRAPLATIFKTKEDPYKVGPEWIYMGSRVTIVGSELHYFAKFVNKAQLSTVWNYKAASIEALRAKFEDVDQFIVEEVNKTR